MDVRDFGYDVLENFEAGMKGSGFATVLGCHFIQDLTLTNIMISWQACS